MAGGLSGTFMGARHIGGQNGQFELQRANNCLLYIDMADSLAGALGKSGDNILTMSLQSFPLPKQSNEPIEVSFLNQKVRFAGQGDTQEMQVTYNDYCDIGTATRLLEWRAMVQDVQTGRIGLARNYKKSAEAHLLSPDGNSKRVYQIEGLWPSMFDPGDADMSSSDGLKINVTFYFDRSYPIETGASWGTTLRRALDIGQGIGQAARAAQDIFGGNR